MEMEIRIPEISENVDSGEIVSVLVAEGDEIQKDQPIIELETEKASFEIPSPARGKVKEITAKPGETVKVGQVIMRVEEEAGQPSETKSAESRRQPRPESYYTPHPESREEKQKPRETTEIPASPSVRREARELGIDLRDVAGTGPGGRITSDDVKAAIRRKMAPAAGVGEPQKAKTGPIRSIQERRIPMSGVRKIIARRTHESWITIPHVTQFQKADITELESFRKRYAARVQNAGGKLTFTAILAKITASGLLLFPDFNASVAIETEEVVYKSGINIGIAVETERGLLVPVIRDAHRKSIIELAAEITDLAQKAREKRITPEEMSEGGFTISNLGGIGGDFFTPIIDPGQSAILGISRASWEPVVREGRIEPRYMLPLSLSFDHRLIDGALGAHFMQWLTEALESPLLLELEAGNRNGNS